MAVKNGAAFLPDQVRSILPQLNDHDELVVSDDCSTDQSIEFLKKLNDSRIKIVQSGKKGLVSNFENSLLHSRGDFIFLADQDDVWAPHKISAMKRQLQTYDLVVSDCAIADEQLEIKAISFFAVNKSGRGLLKNLVRNSYMGCCMGFQRKVLEKALPFPSNLPMHDLWIGLVAESHFNVLFLKEPLVHHRRHTANASTTAGKSNLTLAQKLSARYGVLIHLLKLNYA